MRFNFLDRKMGKIVKSSLDEYLENVQQEFKYISSEVWEKSFFLYDLREMISSEFIDTKIYTMNKHLFDRFLFLLQGYNQVGDDVLEELKETAKSLVGMLTIYNAESDSIVTKKKSSDLIFEDRIKKLENGLSNLERQQKEIFKLNQIVINSQNEANRIISELKDKNDAYSQLIDEDSNARILKLYTSIYDDEIEIANKYRNWALGIFAMIGFILIFGFLNISIQNWNNLRDSSYIHIPLGWDSFIKTLMLFSLTTPAWYLTRESSKHRKVAYKARMLGTELASFPLYAREFKDEDRLELRKHLADRFFGQELYSDSKTTNSNDNSLEQMKLMNETNKVLAEALKAKKVLEN